MLFVALIYAYFLRARKKRRELVRPRIFMFRGWIRLQPILRSIARNFTSERFDGRHRFAVVRDSFTLARASRRGACTGV